MINNKVSKMLRGVAILIVIASHYAEWMYVEAVHLRAREVISTLGPIGVSIFFLLSGYGLTKSAAKGETGRDGGITPNFVLKRFMASYFPYIVVIGIINSIQHTWEEADAGYIKDFLTGFNYWYMYVLFIMYIAFMVIWRYGYNMIIRLILITAAIIGLTVRLYNIGRADFWELSNIAFLIGIYAAVLERYCPQFMAKKANMAVVAMSGLAGTVFCLPLVYSQTSFGWEMTENIFFSFMVLGIAYLIPTWKGYILTSLGESSLFIYLIHTAMFWAIVFKFEDATYMKASSLTALITLVAGVIIGKAYNKFTSFLLKG